MNLRENIKKQLKLLNEQVYNLIPGTPTLGKRIYGCSCELTPGLPLQPYNWVGYEGWDQTLNNGQGGIADWATTYPLQDGMGRVYTNAEYALLPQVVRNSLWAFGALPIGPVSSPAGYLFCPPHNGTSYSTWYQGMNRIVDCQLPQDGQILQANGGVNMKIAHNGAFLDEFKPWLYPTANQNSAPCPTGGDEPLSIDCSHQYNNCATNGGIPACSVIAPVPGCTDPTANNYDPNATQDDGSCTYDPVNVQGCTDNDPNTNGGVATNYNPNATVDDGSCAYTCYACVDGVVQIAVNPNSGGSGTMSSTMIDTSGGQHWGYCGVASWLPAPNNILNMDPNWSGFATCGTTSGYVPGVGYVGTKPIDTDREKWEKDLIKKGIDREDEEDMRDIIKRELNEVST